MSAEPAQEKVRLAPVDDTNRAAIAAMVLGEAQAHFVASNADSLAEAEEDADARPRAVFAGEQLVGFLMYDASGSESEARIYRLMIDPGEQGKGYGRAVVQAALSEIRALGHVREVSICYDPGNEAARRLYRAAGFQEEGLDEDGEMIARLVWPAGEAGR